MMTSYRRLLSALVLGLAFLATSAAAQSTDPNEIQRQLKIGDTIAIVDLEGTETRGQLAAVSDGVLEFRPIVPGAAANEYRTVNTLQSVSIDRIAALTRVDPFGAHPEPIFQRHDSFGTLPERVKPGQMVRVTERSGATIVGRVTDVSASKLVLNLRRDNPRDGSGRPRHEWTGEHTFTPSVVQKIERPAPIWDGAVKGAAIAAALTWMVTASVCRYDCVGLAAGYAMTSGIGAGIGLGIDALFGPKRLYHAPK